MTEHHKSWRFVLLLSLVCVFLFTHSLSAEPVRIILDTDMSGDCDDAGAMAVLHALADRDECEILAAVTNRKDKTNASAAAVDAINTYYGRPHIPIGTDKVGGVALQRTSSFARELRDKFPNDIGPDDKAPDALTVYQRVLADQPDASVTICSIGAFSNLAELCRKSRDLVQRKVKRLVVMGGAFPKSTNPETNAAIHPAATKFVADEWPTEIVWHGFEVGNTIITGAGLKRTPETNPVRLAYTLKPFNRRPALEGGQPSWDQGAALYAVRGPETELWEVVREGRVHVDEKGNTNWEASTSGRHAYVKIKDGPQKLTAIIEALMSQPPAKSRISSQGDPSVAEYNSIQDALNANRGRLVYLPHGDYKITEKLRIRGDNSGLYGPGRIIQTNPNARIVEIENARGVRISGITLTRAADKMDTREEAVLAIRCTNLVLENLQVIGNRTCSAAIDLHECRFSQILFCLVQDYMRISVDDRTASPDWGYAFNCIDGTGITVNNSHGVLVQGNRVIETHLLPTPEIKKQYDLGKVIKKNAQKGLIANQKLWDEGYANNWHQGSAIVINSPNSTESVQVLGNMIENAAQGMDIHADQVTIAQNIVNNAFMGMKAMHGSRNILIIGNQFIKNDLWSIGLMPGAASHAAASAANGKPAVEANVDGGSIIANNIISDFGYGNAHWIWGDEGTPIRFDKGQKPDNPPLTDVIVQGNIVYNTGRDKIIVDGKAVVAPPRYQYAVRCASEDIGIHFSNNILHPGLKGVSNIELKP